MFYVCQCILYQPIYFTKGNANDAVLLVDKLGCVQEKVQQIFFYKPGVVFLVKMGICMKPFFKHRRRIVCF